MENTEDLKNLNILDKDNHDIPYRFYELRDVFGYSFLGEWRKDLFGDKSVSIIVNKKIFNKAYSDSPQETIRHLVYLLLLSTCSCSECIKYEVIKNEEDNNYLYCIHADIDPTAFVMGTIRVARVADMKFSNNRANTLSLVDMIAEIVKGNSAKSSKDYVSNYISDILKDIYGRKYFGGEEDKGIDEVLWFLLKHTDVTYNIIKRTVKHFLYFSDENLVPRKIEKRPFELMKEFYKQLSEQFNKIKDLYSGYSKINSIYIEQNDIVEWFMESDCYGKYVCILNKNKEEYNSNSEKYFYRYSCGMEFIDKTYTLRQCIMSINADETFKNYFLSSFTEIDLNQKFETHQKESILDELRKLLQVKYLERVESMLGTYTSGDFFLETMERINGIIFKSNTNTSDTLLFETLLKRALDTSDFNEVSKYFDENKLKYNNWQEIDITSLKDNRIKYAIKYDASIEQIFDIARGDVESLEEDKNKQPPDNPKNNNDNAREIIEMPSLTINCKEIKIATNNIDNNILKT